MKTRKKITYVLRNQKIYVGLEDSKKSWKICVRSNHRIVHETSFPADYTNLTNYFTNKFPNCQIKVVYEAGFRGFNLYDKLIADGYQCVVTPPHTVTEQKCQRTKNDRIDCRRLAKVLENQDCGTCFVPTTELRADRSVLRSYGQLDKKLVRIKNQIRRAIEYHGLEEHFEGGVWNDSYYKKVNTLFSYTLRHTIGESLYYTFKSLFEQLRFYRRLKMDTLKQLRRISQKPCYVTMFDLYKTAPGIGFITAITLTLEIGDMNRFKRKEQFCKFLGLIPWESSTGEQEHKGHITKQGSRSMRKYLVEAAWVAIRKDPALSEAYERLVRNTASKKKAIVAIARKLALRLRALVLSGIEYQLGVVE